MAIDKGSDGVVIELRAFSNFDGAGKPRSSVKLVSARQLTHYIRARRVR